MQCSCSSWFLTRPDGKPVHFLAHEWNHFCFSFDATTSHVRVAVNGKPTNVDHVEPRLRDVDLPEDILSKGNFTNYGIPTATMKRAGYN